MLTYILYVLVALFVYLFYQLDGHRIVTNHVMTRYRRFRSLNQLVSTRQKNLYMVMWISFKMILQALYVSFLQYTNKAIKRIDRNTYEVSYVIEGKLYKMLVLPQRGPAPILLISDDQDEDVTTQVLPYLGPNYNWHGVKTSPEFFGHKSLTFELADGTEKTFSTEEHVHIE